MKLATPMKTAKYLTPFPLYFSLMILAAGADTAAPAKTKPAPADPKDMKQISAPPDKESPLQFHIGIPAWASAISSKAGVGGAVSSAKYISFTGILEHLDLVVPGSVQVDYGKWGFLVEGQYTKLGLDYSKTIDLPAPGPFSPSVALGGTVQMEQAFADVNLGYKVVDSDKLTVSPFIGTRFEYLRLHGTLETAGPLGGKSFDETGSQAWADPILGLQASYQVFKPVAVVAKADVGGFGAASKLTYQFFAGARTQVTRSLYMDAGYRYMSTDYSSGGFTYNMAFQGPQITFGVNF